MLTDAGVHDLGGLLLLDRDVKVTGTLTVNNQLIASSGTIPSFMVTGTTLTDSAPLSRIGEYNTGTVTSFTNFAATGQFGNITSVVLTAGDYDVSGCMATRVNGATFNGQLYLAISINSGNTTTDHVLGHNEVRGFVPTATTNNSLCVPRYRISTAGTTVYLKGAAEYSAGNPQYVGTMTVRRVR